MSDIVFLLLEESSLFEDSPCSMTGLGIGPIFVKFSTFFCTRWVSLSVLELLLDLLAGTPKLFN